ncbi:MAG: glyoxalase/bleomycin resistance/dioxygenase family protein [Methanomassiliicoccaceae archaeon]|jgi:catechol 2,3-dioxygenase-like lactoylglutathione lyase family enzyme|nr:glyoxalase/bleomycin resistance/dioxygenase family protein [Methanomassiliicoccaceae archaeon]
MRYHGVAIAVDDVNASRKFYEDIFGMDLFQDYGICVAFAGGLSLQQEFDRLVGVPKDKMIKGSNNMELYFEEDDLDAFLKKLENYPGINYLHSVKEQPWGQRTIRFYDPDRHIIEVGENLKSVIGRFFSMGMSMDEISKKMGVSAADLEKLLNS